MAQAATPPSLAATPPAQPSSLPLPGMDSQQQRAIFDAIREVVANDIECLVDKKADILWQRGKQMFAQLQTKHKERINKLEEEVVKCSEKQHVLEAENEKLKQGIQNLHSRFSLLGAAFNGSGSHEPATVPLPGGESNGVGTLSSTASICSGSSPPPPVKEFLPEKGPAFIAGIGADSTKNGSKMPDVPAFPFPPGKPPPPPPWQLTTAAASASTAAVSPLSLAEALGTQTPQRTPLSLLSSLTPTVEATGSTETTQTRLQNTSPSSSRPSSFSLTPFTFTLRKAEGADLGLNVSHCDCDRALRVDGIRPSSAVEAWNRQCVGSACPEKALMSGDEIVKVNDVAYDAQGMLAECRDKNLLKFHVLRGDRSQKSGKQSTALRADASIFVPMRGAEAPPSLARPEEMRRLFPDGGVNGASTSTQEAKPQTATVERPSERVWLAPKEEPQAEAKVEKDE